MSTDRDERTTATADRWLARGMAILMIALPIDVLVRILILKQHPGQHADISLIWIATAMYVAIGMTANGVAPFGGKWWKMWPIIPLVAVTNTVVLTLIGMVHTWADLILTITLGIIGGAAGVFLILFILRGIYGVWERRTLGRAPREE